MKLQHALLAAVSIGAVLAPNAQAAEKKHAKPHHHHTAPAAKSSESVALKSEVEELKAQVTALREEIKAQRETVATTQTAVAQTQVQVTQTQQQVGSLSQSVAETPKLAKAAADTEVASAIEKEHAKGYIDFKGIRITPGGFLELAGVYRQHYQGNDIASSFSVPFPNAHNYYVGEGRFTARQSRLSFLAQGKPSEHTTLSMYGEFDFQGAAQTANSNESNSYNPRIRVLYGQVDWDRGDSGIHFLAGQSWSLATLQGKGLTPRSEVIPLVIDAQYVPGFAWTRNPGVRLAADFADHHLWIGASVESPATLFGGTVPSTVTSSIAGGSGYNSANSLTLNSVPDFIEKVAYQGDIAGHALHIEGMAIERTATARVNGEYNVNKGSAGFGGGVTLQAVPQVFDLQFSYLGGKGIGRYGSTQLPDVTFDADGSIHAIKETIMLGGAVLHPTSMLDVYGYAGEEFESALPLSGSYGIGNLAANDSGCFTEGGTCGGNTRAIRQITAGLWQKIYSGSFGRAQVGLQYDYTQRELFVSNNSNGVPRVNQNMGLISFRYYPF